jgi:hypothetical protein
MVSTSMSLTSKTKIKMNNKITKKEVSEAINCSREDFHEFVYSVNVGDLPKWASDKLIKVFKEKGSDLTERFVKSNGEKISFEKYYLSGYQLTRKHTSDNKVDAKNWIVFHSNHSTPVGCVKKHVIDEIQSIINHN